MRNVYQKVGRDSANILGYKYKKGLGLNCTLSVFVTFIRKRLDTKISPDKI